MQYDITAVGEILVDMTPAGLDEHGDVRFARKAGGAPFNLLAAAAKFGMKTAFFGKVGNDLFGRFLAETVESAGVGGSIAVDPVYPTTLAFVTLTPDGDRDFSFYRRFGADTRLAPDDLDPAVIDASRVFHFGSLSLTDEPAASATRFALERAKRADCVISYDPNYRAPLWPDEKTAVRKMREILPFADIVKTSREEALMIAHEKTVEAALDFLAASGASVVLVTDGPHPVTAYVRGETFTVPPHTASTVDTTGAGDIFFGAFLTGFLKSGTPLVALTAETARPLVEKATRLAALSTEKHGAVASIPDWNA